MVAAPVRAFIVALGTVMSGSGCSSDAVQPRPSSISDAAAEDVTLARDPASMLDGASRPDASSSCNGATCGGSCIDGRCLVTLAIAPSPGNLVVRGADVFFTSCSPGMGQIAKVSLAPASPFELATGRRCPSGLAVNGRRLYVGGWDGFVDVDASGAELAALSLDVDADAAPSLLVPGTDSIVGVAADGADVYFTTTTALMWVAPSGGSPRALISDLGSATRPLLDAANVYVGDASIGAVLRVARNSGVQSTLATGLPAIQAIALGVADVLVGGAYLVRTVALDGGAIGVVATAAGAEVQSVAADDANAYFTSYGVVWKAPLHGGGEPIALASNQSDAVAIAVDDASVYWVDFGSNGATPGTCCGKILKLTPK